MGLIKDLIAQEYSKLNRRSRVRVIVVLFMSFGVLAGFSSWYNHWNELKQLRRNYDFVVARLEEDGLSELFEDMLKDLSVMLELPPQGTWRKQLEEEQVGLQIALAEPGLDSTTLNYLQFQLHLTELALTGEYQEMEKAIAAREMALITQILADDSLSGQQRSELEQKYHKSMIDFRGSKATSVYSLAYQALSWISRFVLPLFVCLVFVDLIPSELTSGVFRLLCVRKATRRNILLSKALFGGGIVCGVILVCAVGTFLVAGTLIGFSGINDYIIVGLYEDPVTEQIIYNHAKLIPGYAHYLLSVISMLLDSLFLGTLSILLGIYLETSGTLMVIVSVSAVRELVGLLSVSGLAVLLPIFNLNHINYWAKITSHYHTFTNPAIAALVLLLFAAMFLWFAVKGFESKDILS